MFNECLLNNSSAAFQLSKPQLENSKIKRLDSFFNTKSEPGIFTDSKTWDSDWLLFRILHFSKIMKNWKNFLLIMSTKSHVCGIIKIVNFRFSFVSALLYSTWYMQSMLLIEKNQWYFFPGGVPDDPESGGELHFWWRILL